MKTQENYEPFGEEWIKEMMKFPKRDLIEIFLKPALMQKAELLKTLIIVNQYFDKTFGDTVPGIEAEIWTNVIQAIKKYS